MTQEPKTVFPLSFTQCPNCGSEKRMAGTILKQEIAKGRLKKETNAFLFTQQSIIAGPPGSWLSAPVIITHYDACVDCGTVYCIHAQVKTIMQGGPMPKPPQPGQFRSN